jgi:hypothetical protein
MFKDEGELGNLKRRKEKLKSKGKKYYQNTQGDTYRVPISFRLRRIMRQKKTERKLEAKHSV